MLAGAPRKLRALLAVLVPAAALEGESLSQWEGLAAEICFGTGV